MTRISIHEGEVEGTRRTEPCARLSKLLVSEHEFGAKQVSMGMTTCDPGGGIPLHLHTDSEEALFVVEGEGILTCGGQTAQLKAGTAFFAPVGVEHGVHNPGPLPLTIVWAYGPPLPEHRTT